MNAREHCFYCTQDEVLDNLMIRIGSLQVSEFYLNRDQTHKGRCILAFKNHKQELFEITPEELRRFMEDVARAAGALQKALGADKINYAIYGDLVSHVHFHLVPKYQGGPQWGDAFENSPATKKTLTQVEYERLLQQIQENL